MVSTLFPSEYASTQDYRGSPDWERSFLSSDGCHVVLTNQVTQNKAYVPRVLNNQML